MSPSPLACSSPQPDSGRTRVDSSTSYEFYHAVNHEQGEEREAILNREQILTGSGPYDRLSSIRVDSESPVTAPPADNTTEGVDRDVSVSQSIGSMSVDFGEGNPLAAGDKKKSRAKKLKGIFKMKGAKSKAKSKAKGQGVKFEESTHVSFEDSHRERKSVDETRVYPEHHGSHSLEPDFELEFKRVVFTSARTPSDVPSSSTTPDDKLVNHVVPELPDGHPAAEGDTQTDTAAPEPLESAPGEVDFPKVANCAPGDEVLMSTSATAPLSPEMVDSLQAANNAQAGGIDEDLASTSESAPISPDMVYLLQVANHTPDDEDLMTASTTAPIIREEIDSLPVAKHSPAAHSDKALTSTSAANGSLGHHDKSNMVEPTEKSVSPGPPPKPKRRTAGVKMVQPEIPTPSGSPEPMSELPVDPPAAKDSQILPNGQGLETQQANGAGWVVREEVLPVAKQADLEELGQDPSTHPIRRSSPQLLKLPPSFTEGKARSSSVDETQQTSFKAISELEDYHSRLRSFSASPPSSERAPTQQTGPGTRECQIPAPDLHTSGGPSTGAHLTRRDAFKARRSPQLARKKQSQESPALPLSESKDPQKPPVPTQEVAQVEDASPTDFPTEAPLRREHSTSDPFPPSRLRSSTGSPLLGQDSPEQQRGEKRMSVPNGTTAAIPSGFSPYSQTPQQLKSTKVSKLLSGSTPVLADSRKPPGKKYSSTADLSANDSKQAFSGELVVRPVHRSTVENIFEEASSSDQILHGLLRIQVVRVDLGEVPRGPKHSITDIILNPDMLEDLPEVQEEPCEGLFCVFTINGGHSRAETSTQPIIPRRPVKWDGDKREFLFYTSQARQVFVMCRKVKLNDSGAASNLGRPRAKRDACIGAAILSLPDLTPSPISSGGSTTNMIRVLQEQQLRPITLPMQPKGSILLQTSFSGKPFRRICCFPQFMSTVLFICRCMQNISTFLCASIDSEITNCI